MATQTFDKLNSLQKERKERKPHSLPYEEYFGEMDISEYQKEERIGLAEKLEKVFVFLFSIIGTPASIGGDIDVIALYDAVGRRVSDVVYEYRESLFGDKYIENYIDKLSKEIVDVTLENLDDAYFKSNDRAKFIAENEANSVTNYQEMREAVSGGYSRKIWVSLRDAHVRDTHAEVDGDAIPIDEYFVVGDSMMLFPKDTSADPNPREVVNCRCSVKYIR